MHGDVWEYTPPTAAAGGAPGGWRSHGEAGDATFVPRCGHAAVSVAPTAAALSAAEQTSDEGIGGGIIYVFGGQDPRSGGLLDETAALKVPAVGGGASWDVARGAVDGVKPQARNGHTLCYDPSGGTGGGGGGGCLVLFGGANAEGHLADVHRLTLLAAPANPVSADEKEDGEAMDEAEAKEVAKAKEEGGKEAAGVVFSSWDAPRCNGPKPTAREMHVAALLPSQRLLVVHGGRGGDDILGDVCALNVATWVWAASRPSSSCMRVGHAAALVPCPAGGDGHLVLFGGFSGATFCNDTWQVSPQADEPCERLPAEDSPQRRFAHAVAALGETLFVFGGSGGNTDYNELHEVDTAATIVAKKAK